MNIQSRKKAAKVEGSQASEEAPVAMREEEVIGLRDSESHLSGDFTDLLWKAFGSIDGVAIQDPGIECWGNGERGRLILNIDDRPSVLINFEEGIDSLRTVPAVPAMAPKYEDKQVIEFDADSQEPTIEEAPLVKGQYVLFQDREHRVVAPSIEGANSFYKDWVLVERLADSQVRAVSLNQITQPTLLRADELLPGDRVPFEGRINRSIRSVSKAVPSTGGLVAVTFSESAQPIELDSSSRMQVYRKSSQDPEPTGYAWAKGKNLTEKEVNAIVRLKDAIEELPRSLTLSWTGVTVHKCVVDRTQGPRESIVTIKAR